MRPHFFFLLCLLTACGVPRAQFDGDVHHTAGRPIRDTAPWQWAEVSREDFLNWRLEDRKALVLPEDTPGVVRARAWLERLDAAVRARHRQQLANVPRPHVLLVASRLKNAQVNTLPVCFRAEVAFESGRASSGRNGLLFYGPQGFDVQLKPREARSFECMFQHGHRLEEVLAWLGRKDPSCRLRSEGGRIVAERNCTQVERVLTGVKATKFALIAMANWIVIESSILGDETLPAPFNNASAEERFVATLAHELGHYYGAHGMLFPEEFRFWYRRKESGRRPTADSSPGVQETVRKIRECVAARGDCSALAAEGARLGWYTEEEEADDFALEALAALGMNLDAAAESHYSVGISYGWKDASSTALDPGPSECARRRKEGWAEPPFLGSLADTHHGSCYRIFNLDREAAGHRYPLATRAAVAAAPTWAQAVASVRAMERKLGVRN